MSIHTRKSLNAGFLIDLIDHNKNMIILPLSVARQPIERLSHRLRLPEGRVETSLLRGTKRLLIRIIE